MTKQWHKTKAARKAAGLSMRQAYESLGITCTQLAKIERGDMQEYGIALKRTKLYGCSLTDLGWLASSVLTEVEEQSCHTQPLRK